MTIATLKDRIEKAQAKIEKKENTIVKKTAQIEKKTAQVSKLGYDPNGNLYEQNGEPTSYDARELMIDIKYLADDIKRGKSEIEEIRKTLEKYNAQLSGEIDSESILLKEIPDSLKHMSAELVSKWDVWDKDRREFLAAEYKKLGYAAFIKSQYTRADYDFIHMTDDQIHASNVKSSRALVLDLYYRVKEITGEVTDWTNIQATQGAQGMSVLNGIVTGKEGRANIESIVAGGYNIQRLHVRVLVHSI